MYKSRSWQGKRIQNCHAYLEYRCVAYIKEKIHSFLLFPLLWIAVIASTMQEFSSCYTSPQQFASLLTCRAYGAALSKMLRWATLTLLLLCYQSNRKLQDFLGNIFVFPTFSLSSNSEKQRCIRKSKKCHHVQGEGRITFLDLKK